MTIIFSHQLYYLQIYILTMTFLYWHNKNIFPTYNIKHM